jgi:hypothetical protein
VLSYSRLCRPMAEHMRHQFMLATPEPGRSGSNPYGRPESHFRASSSDSSRILSTAGRRPPCRRHGRPVRCVAMRRRADEHQRSVSHVDGPVAKWSNDHRDHFCEGSSDLARWDLRRQMQGLERDRARGCKEKIALIGVPRRRRWCIRRKRSWVKVQFSEFEPRRLRLRFSSS